MFTTILRKTLLLGGVLAFVSTANAVPITFDFTGGGPNANALPFVDAATGVALTVRARNTTDNEAAQVTWNNNGLGVRSNDEIGAGGTSGQLDSFGDNERLNFNVTDLVNFASLELVSITFWNLDITGGVTEDFGVRFDGNNPFAGGFGNNFTPGSNPWIVENDLDFSMRTFSSQFALLLNGDNSMSDQFRIASITFNAIPEPTLFALLGAGLIGLGLARRRRSTG